MLHRLITRIVLTMTSKSARRFAQSGRAAGCSPRRPGWPTSATSKRVETMGSLLRSIVTFVVATLPCSRSWRFVGIPLGPLLASAGVAGVALGFGAQSLVKDFISGLFMLSRTSRRRRHHRPR